MLGKTVQDKITGFRGVVTGYVEYISGCNQVLIAPKTSESGDFIASQWVDVQRVVVDESVVPIILDNGNTPGSDRAAPRR